MIYLDNAATTKPYFIKPYEVFEDDWFNSNSDYSFRANKILEEARNDIKKSLKVESGKVLFFRGATEAINWLADRLEEYRPMPICSSFEHDSVNNRFWSAKDVGKINVCQFVNHITGQIFNIEIISKCKKDEHEFFFSDFTAAIGKVEIPDNLETYCDAIWFSGHKFHTEKGIGAMWISDRLADYLGATNSSNNQYGLVHGTVDVSGAKMLGNAMKTYSRKTYIEELENKCQLFSSIIKRDLDNAGVHCDYVYNNDNKTHAINALTFKDINGDALRNYLINKDIYVGAGHSACSEDADYRVLEAFGLTKEEAERTIRISFSMETTLHEIKYFIEEVIDFYKMYGGIN